MHFAKHLSIAVFGVAAGVVGQANPPFGKACQSFGTPTTPPPSTALCHAKADNPYSYSGFVSSLYGSYTDEQCAQNCWADGRCKSYSSTSESCILWNNTASAFTTASDSGSATWTDRACQSCVPPTTRACSKLAPSLVNAGFSGSSIFPWVITGPVNEGWYFGGALVSKSHNYYSFEDNTVYQQFGQYTNVCKGSKVLIKAKVTNKYDDGEGEEIPTSKTPFKMTVSLGGQSSSILLPQKDEGVVYFSHTFTATVNNPALIISLGAGQKAYTLWVLSDLSMKKA